MEKSHGSTKQGSVLWGMKKAFTLEKGEWGREVPAEEGDIAIYDIEPMWGEAGIQMWVEQIGPCKALEPRVGTESCVLWNDLATGVGAWTEDGEFSTGGW